MPEPDTTELEALKIKAELVCKVMRQAVREAFELKVKLGHSAVVTDGHGHALTIGPKEISERLKSMPVERI